VKFPILFQAIELLCGDFFRIVFVPETFGYLDNLGHSGHDVEQVMEI
jgi:hypothetical protein